MELTIQVPPTYPPGCQVVFVGEAPGATEVQQGEGFVGQAGRVLQKIVFASGLQWDRIGRTNVVKRAPDGGYDSEHFQKTFYKTTKEGKRKIVQPGRALLEWYELLKQELQEHQPRVIVACGVEALVGLTGNTGITKNRGSILQCTFENVRAKVIPIIHPSAIIRSANWQELYISSEIIARKVMPILRNEWTGYLPWEQITQPTIQDWIDFTRRIDGPFSLDIETRAGSIACVGIAARFGSGDSAICVPIQTTKGPYFDDPADEWEFWRTLQGLCERQTLVGHNLLFDIDWLRDYGIKPTNVVDTMLLFHRVYPELPKSLAFVSMWLTDIPYYKDDGQTWGHRAPDERLWDYNIKDCVATLRAYWSLMSMDPAKRRLYDEHTTKILPLAFEMQTLGMDADVVGVDFARRVLTDELDKIRSRLSDLSGGKLVTREGNKKITDRQVADYLYGDLKLPVKRNRKTKAVTADEDALVDLLIQFPDLEVLKAINAERKFGKALNSYINIDWR